MRPKLTTANNKVDGNYVPAVHDAGHIVAAFVLGCRRQRKGMNLREDLMQYCYPGFAYWLAPAARCLDLTEPEERANIVVTLAGPVAQAKVDPRFIALDPDAADIAWSLRKLLHGKRRFMPGELGNDEWSDAWVLARILASSRRQQRAFEKVVEHERIMTAVDGYPGPKLGPAFKILWPLAQQARAIIDAQWTLVNTIACDLVKAGRLGTAEMEAFHRERDHRCY